MRRSFFVSHLLFPNSTRTLSYDGCFDFSFSFFSFLSSFLFFFFFFATTSTQSNVLRNWKKKRKRKWKSETGENSLEIRAASVPRGHFSNDKTGRWLTGGNLIDFRVLPSFSLSTYYPPASFVNGSPKYVHSFSTLLVENFYCNFKLRALCERLKFHL